MYGTFVLNALIALSVVASNEAKVTVTQVQVLFRHGERTPRLKEMYPRDIYSVADYEPWGLGQLTNVGKRREYKIGQVLKRRYKDLLGSLYVPRDVYAVSTDCDRTKMSLQLVLAGLFPPGDIQTWHTEIPWHPIPIHYVPTELDIVMKASSCPQYKDTVAQILQLPEVKAKIAVYEPLFKFLTLKTGLNITTLKEVYEIYNLVVAQQAMNLTLSEWTTDSVVKKMSEVTVLYYAIRSYTTQAKRLNGGPMVRQFIENMRLESADRAREKSRKIYLYSAHEVTISSYLQALGITEQKIPFYGTAIMIERLEDTEGKIYVRMILWTGVTEQLVTLRLPGCEDICPIERYLQLTRELIPSDEEMDCHWRRLSDSELRRVIQEQTSQD
ncbi:venom acid phosphatase Acph-1-like [Athalia rosae]|uniref:venom acid phosphatase Acph-1-like n=1 Tax=Athalia rosae TaxID=37344 RepID=UPI0020334DA6|nr:venom acid phosphatase Acph-1-like [Athalia rosae]